MILISRKENIQTHMNSHKNAYEIRLEILKMANDAHFGKYHQAIDSERTGVNSDGQLVSKVVSVERINELFPKNSDIISHAEELYKFVCQN